VYVLTGHELTADKAFVALSLFNLLQFPVSMFPIVISSLVEASVSVNRVFRFLTAEELDPDAIQQPDVAGDEVAGEVCRRGEPSPVRGHGCPLSLAWEARATYSRVGAPQWGEAAIESGTFTWGRDLEPALRDINLTFRTGSLTGMRAIPCL
jgi:ABC-type multidrug transport system fused ATPase/permease subunit